MRRAEIEAQDRRLLARQREFRMAADVVTNAWMTFEEAEAVAVIGSAAKALAAPSRSTRRSRASS